MLCPRTAPYHAPEDNLKKRHMLSLYQYGDEWGTSEGELPDQVIYNLRTVRSPLLFLPSGRGS
jgi:hypothetical protein